MSNLVVEGFGTYGTGLVIDGSGILPVGQALLSGVWAEVPVFQNAAFPLAVGLLPWDASDPSLWLSRHMRATSISEGSYPGATSTYRRVMPSNENTMLLSMRFATSFLSTETEIICGFNNNANVAMGYLVVLPSGQMSLLSPDLATIYATTSGPVIVAATATPLEMQFSAISGTFQLRVNSVTVINASAIAFSLANQVSQIRFFPAKNTVITRPVFYMTDLIMRNTAGTVNNTFMGDRRVATLLVNSDDPAHQGWTAFPLKKFGNGILDLTAGDKACITVPNTTFTDLGAGDFTLEGQVRFNVLPSGANKMTIFGKWDAGAQNKRSYQLFKGGPGLNGGATVFQISTTGTAGTVVTVISTLAWVPLIGTYYHIAIERKTSVTTLYINGVAIAFAADANTYFAGTAPTIFGAETVGTSTITVNTSLLGWLDEVRFTVGLYRYGASFTPPSVAFPRGGADPNFANVGVIFSFDSGIIADESNHALSSSAFNGAVAVTPNDGVSNYQVMAKQAPSDTSFLAAAFLQATGTYTLSSLPANNDTVTLATKAGPAAAVYTWKTTLTGAAFEVKIGTLVADCITNIVAAINLAAGAGTLYGTGTTANLDTTAAISATTTAALTATAIVPGTGGNALASTRTGTAGAWGAATLLGGVNIPANSQFGYTRLPTATTAVDSVTILTRSWKSDAGTATLQTSFVGSAGGVLSGISRAISTVPTVYLDTIEADPDTAGPLTPTSVALGKLRLNRTS